MLKKIEDYLNWLIYNKPIPKPKRKKKVASTKKALSIEDAYAASFTTPPTQSKSGGSVFPVISIWFDEIEKTVKLHAYGRSGYFYLPSGGHDMYSHWLIDYSSTSVLPNNETIYKLMGVGKKNPDGSLVVASDTNNIATQTGSVYVGSTTSSLDIPAKKEVGVSSERIKNELLSRAKLKNRLPSDLIRKKYSLGTATIRPTQSLEPIPSPQSDLVIERAKKLAGVFTPVNRPKSDWEDFGLDDDIEGINPDDVIPKPPDRHW